MGMKFTSVKIGVVFGFIASIITPTVSADSVWAYQQANRCRAAIEAQDSSFRIYNDRVKNESANNVFLICPLDHTFDSSGAPVKLLRVFIANEGTGIASVTCSVYGYNQPWSFDNTPIPFSAPQAPNAFASDSIQLPADNGQTLTLQVGSAAYGANYLDRFNLVCLLPPQVSLVEFANSQADRI